MIPAIQRRVVILAHRRRGYEIEALVREHRAIGLLVEVCHPRRDSHGLIFRLRSTDVQDHDESRVEQQDQKG